MLELLMREDGFPEIWMPSSEQRDLREVSGVQSHFKKGTSDLRRKADPADPASKTSSLLDEASTHL